MKIRKNGTIQLGPRDRRIGNFVVTDGDDYIRLQDISSVYNLRVSKRMPLGIWLAGVLSRGEAGDDTLKTYISVMWSLLSVAPDDGFVRDLLDASAQALQRHPDWYGYNTDPTPEEDAEAAREVREMKQFEQDLKDLPDEAGTDKNDDGHGGEETTEEE